MHSTTHLATVPRMIQAVGIPLQTGAQIPTQRVVIFPDNISRFSKEEDMESRCTWCPLWRFQSMPGLEPNPCWCSDHWLLQWPPEYVLKHYNIVPQLNIDAVSQLQNWRSPVVFTPNLHQLDVLDMEQRRHLPDEELIHIRVWNNWNINVILSLCRWSTHTDTPRRSRPPPPAPSGTSPGTCTHPWCG